MLFNLCVDLIFNGRISFNIRSYLDYSLVAVIITLFISLTFTARRFFISWRDLAVQHEKLNTVAIESRFAALKNQVNPHFLFNSLNVLTNLVYKDPDQSARFIQKLAQVYRYVLDTQEKEMVPLVEELDFVRSFAYLQKMRFGQYLEVNINIPDDTNIFVLPLSIQMLVEKCD